MARIQLKIWMAPLATLSQAAPIGLAEGEIAIASETNTIYKRPDGNASGALIPLGSASNQVRAKAATTANITLSGTQTIDGVAVVAGDVVLVKNQTTASQNGLYTVAAGAWVRTAGANMWTNIVSMMAIVERGTTNADTVWVCSSDSGGTLGTTAISFLEIANSTSAILGSVTPATDTVPYFTSSSTAGTTALTSFARTLLDDVDATTARGTLGAAPVASPALTGTPTAPTAAVNTNTTQLATTAFVVGQAATVAPAALATAAAVGTSTQFARQDHVHALPTASQITSTATGDIAATNVQAAIAELAAEKLNLSGGTMTGALTLSGDPTSDLHPATKRWVESLSGKNSVRAATVADLEAGSVSGSVLTGKSATYVTNGTTTASSTSVTGVASAASAIQVGATVTGTGIPASTTVTAVSGTTVTLSQAATAAGTVSLTFTNSITARTIDGVTLALNDRVLVKNQTIAAQNGIYYLSTLGTTSVPWVLTRASDADTWGDLVGATVPVEEGVVNAETQWLCTVNRGGTLNTSSVVFQLVSNAQLAAIGAIATTGLLARTAANTFVTRAITQGTGLTVTNGDAIAGNPVVALANTAVAAGSYGSTTTSPTFTVDAQGRITNASNVTITPAFSSITGKPTTISGYGITDAASLVSPALTGTPTAPTAAVGTNSTQLATTAYVRKEITAITGISTDSTVLGVGATVPGADSVTDLNDITTPGWYYKMLGTGNANLPESGRYWYLEVVAYGTSGNVTQILYPYQAGLSSSYMRSSYSGTWSDWQESFTTRNFNPALKANLASPAFTGVPTAPTAVAGTNNTQLATTAFVQSALGSTIPSITTSGSATIGGNLTVTGNLTINGTTTTFNSNTMTVDDPIMTLGGETVPTVNDNKDRGVEFRWHNGTSAKVGFFGFDNSTSKFTFIPDAVNTSEVFSGAVGTIVANLEGSVTGNASTATTLATARTITATGDATSSAVSFNGSANISIPLTLADSGVTAGTYPKVTVDAKGRVTAGASLVAADIPSLDWSKIATGKPTTLAGYGITDAAALASPALTGTPTAPTAVAGTNTTQLATTAFVNAAVTAGAVASASKLTTARTITASGDATSSAVSFDGSANISIPLTLANSGVTAGTYPKVTVDAKGRVTAGSALAATDIPSLDWSKIATGKPTTLSGYGITDAAPLASPALTGIPTAPTAAAGTNNTQLATTAFVNAEIASDAAAKVHTHSIQDITDSPYKDAVRVATTVDLGAAAQTAMTLTGKVASYVANGTTTTSSTSVTGVTNAAAAIQVGATVTGTGIPASTTVAAVSGTTVTLSQAATATGTVSLTFTNTISALVIDGVTLALNDRVLVKNQTALAQNGIYYLSTLGTSSVAWVLTRSANNDTAAEVAGSVTTVDSGTTNGGRMFTTTFKSTDTLGTTACPWFEVPANANLLTAGRALVTDGNGRLDSSTVTAIELGYVSGVTGAIQSQLNAKAALASPALTGTPTAPTAAAGTNTTQLATTAFVLANAVTKDSTTGAASLPTGTTAQRPANGAGKIRFNTTLGRPEVNNGTSWGSMGGATGGGTDAVFYLNDQTVTTNYTVPTGQNAMSAGPITIANGITVTVSDDSTWTVV